MQDFKSVYETMIGMYRPEYAPAQIENAFYPGGFCMEEYGNMRDAYERICDRLGCESGEDPDLDAMVDALEAIQKELCRRMYMYCNTARTP